MEQGQCASGGEEVKSRTMEEQGQAEGHTKKSGTEKLIKY
jgi:hypothetical protein